VAADRHDRVLEVAGPERTERALVAGIDLDRMGDLRRDAVHERQVVVDGEDLMAQGHQLEGGRGPESTEAHDQHRMSHPRILLPRQPMLIVSTAGR
jgi:hypothetical protein